MPEISVLIPVYNAGKYLSECLRSVQQQTFADIEIICIDDGSGDNSAHVLRQFQIQEPRLKIITQKNAGVAVTRNRLMEAARGKYIAFVDADDRILPDYLKKLYTAAETNGAEVALCFLREMSEDGTYTVRLHVPRRFYKNPAPHPAAHFRRGYEDAVVAVKLWRLSWLRQHKLKFYPGRVAEDIVFAVLGFTLARQIAVVPEALYRYRKGVSSSITANAVNMAVSRLKNFYQLRQELIGRGIWSNEIKNEWIRAAVRSICHWYKLPLEKRTPYTSLQQHLFRAACETSRELHGLPWWRWNTLFLLTRICGPRYTKMWLKIFR